MELAITEEDGVVDFSDMLYLPIKQRLSRGEYDVVVVDEAQDMNRAQLDLAEMVLKEDGRIVVVGDRHQAIYGFRGADSNSMSRLAEKFEGKHLPLTVTYRCSKRVTEVAQQYVPDLQCADSNPEGSVSELPATKLLEVVQPGDFILSRANGPLIPICLSLIRMGKRARLAGRDLGRSLINIIMRLDKFNGRTDVLLQKLGQWSAQQMTVAADDEDRKKLVADQVLCIRELAEDYERVADLTAGIEKLFVDVEGATNDMVVCSTVHKAKGLEADRVFLLRATFKDLPGRPLSTEEKNIRYVAITRSKRDLFWVVGEIK
jgi:superfamily I DNA/RNA helicase